MTLAPCLRASSTVNPVIEAKRTFLSPALRAAASNIAVRSSRVKIAERLAATPTTTSAKIEAARALDLRVVMIERPSTPPGEQVDTPEAALAWLMRHADIITA